MRIKIKIKNKLDENYNFLTDGEIEKRNNFNKKIKNQKNKDQIKNK